VTRPIRILQLLVSTALGGGPEHVWQVIRGLPREEFAPLVAAPRDGPLFQRFRDLGVEVVEMPLNRLRPGVLADVVRLIRDRGIDVVHSHGKGAGLYGRCAAWWTHAAAVHTFHGIHYDEYPRWVVPLYLSLERGLARLTRVVINVSWSQEREGLALNLFSMARSRVIVNGVDVATVRDLVLRRGVSRAQLGLRPDVPVIGTVARFDPVKSIGLVLEALSVLRQRIPAHLVLAGGGGEEVEVRRQAAAAGLAEHVTFLGPNKDAVRILSAVDVFVSGSRKEGLPLTILEAMACGVPVVATRVPGNVDIVVDSVTGLLTDPGSARDLAEKLAILLGDPERRRAMGEVGRRRVEEAFSIERMVTETADVYRWAAAPPTVRAPDWIGGPSPSART
jgi:glycosyltransferase involved in cell wall biosynthesis